MLLGVLTPFLVFAQLNEPAVLNGHIINEQNEAVIHATVVIKGTSTGTVTNASGTFSLTVDQDPPFTLAVSSAGFVYRELPVQAWPDAPLEIVLSRDRQLSEVAVTARRRSEAAQDVPIPISVVGGGQIDDAGAFTVNRIKEIVPSVQMYTSNPRNTGVNIRGIGSPFGLTNDGLDPGVGFYIDGVYIARPAIATLDFLDVEQIEVLRGPQGTLFGKNTTSGAISITTRKPSFKPGATFETSYGNYGFVQARASVTGPFSKKVAGRFSFSGTQRDGTVYNQYTSTYINDINNLGFKGQILYKPVNDVAITVAGDLSRQRPVGYAQVPAGVAVTKRAAYRQFGAITSDLGYQLPSLNAFDRTVDQDVPWRSGNDLGGVSLNADIKLGPGTLTSTTAWRYWDWDPSNDRDFTGLPSLTKSQNPSKHRNWSQELRYAGEISSRLSGVVGLFALGQEVKTNGTEESGPAQWRFSQSSTSSLWATPGLLEGYGIATTASIKSLSAAVFANADWEVVKGLHVLPGIRLNYDKKEADYNRVASGGLNIDLYNGSAEDKATLQSIKNGVYSSQAYTATADETNFTYQLTVAYRPNRKINAYATYSTSYKPVAVNVAGLPNVSGRPDSTVAVIRPEYTTHYELGVKTTLTNNFIFNVTFHNSDIRDYQTNVQAAQLGVNRGYIANADKVNVHGLEIDANFRANSNFSFYGAVAYTDGKYKKFTNAPLPLEETGATNEQGQQEAFKDVSGGDLPGISKWSGSLGGEFSTPVTFLGNASRFFVAIDGFYRSSFSSSATPSAVLNIDGYALFNGRIGFKASHGLSVYAWGRNLLNQNYHEQLLAAGGNAGLYASVLGDPRTYGITLRYAL